MVLRRAASAAALLLCAALLAASVASARTRDRRALAEAELTEMMRTPHFAVHYDPVDPFLAKLMAETAQDELVRISNELGYGLESHRTFPLYVFPTHIGFIEAGGLETSKFTVGTATSGIDKIAVDASGAFAPPDQVLSHEITHAIIFRLLGPSAGALPLWANEGLAKYYSREPPNEDDQVLAAAAADGTLMPLADLEASFPDGRSALAYAESASAARYLVKHYGRTAPRTLLAEMARTGSFDKAMLKATRRTGDRFAEEWYDDLSQSLWPLRYSRIGAGIVSAIMAILAIAAFVARRRKMADAARQWEEEEMERRRRGNYYWPEE